MKYSSAIFLLVVLTALTGAVVGAGNWQPLRDDGLHDPSNPAIEVLQEPGEASDATAAELQTFVKQSLAPYKYPRWIEFVEALPKTATGKVQRFKLRARSPD